MSTPDYPLLTVPGYELYQLAHLTTFAVDALARHRRTAAPSDRLAGRVAAAVETPTDAVDCGPAQVNASPGGFPAAATALPRPGAIPPHSATRTPRNDAAARPAPTAAARPAPSPRPTAAP